MSNNRALLYKAMWKGWSAKIWIRPSVLKNANKGFKNDQNYIAGQLNKELKIGEYIEFENIKITGPLPPGGIKQNPQEQTQTQSQPQARPYASSSFARGNGSSHCGDDNCRYCEFGQYSKCPNNK